MSDPPRPKKRTIRQGRDLVAAWRSSGLSATAFCREHRIDPKRLSWWKRRLRHLDQAAPPAASASAFIQLPVDPPPEPFLIEVTLLNGIRLSIHPHIPIARLSAVVTALSGIGAA